MDDRDEKLKSIIARLRIEWWRCAERGCAVLTLCDLSESLLEEVKMLRADAARLDWMADRDNAICNVQLPTICVTRNLHSLRSAIDDAMQIDQRACPHMTPNAGGKR